MNKATFKEAWTGEADCHICVLRSSVLFAGLKEDDFECIHSPIDVLTLPEGSLLYRTGEEGRYMYTLRQGLIKLVQYLPDGGQRIVRLLRATDVAGLEALLGQPYQHDAVILNKAELCRLPIDIIQCLDQKNPTLHRELMARWQRALSEADAWLTELSTGSSRQRVARLLLRLTNGNADATCELFSREDMGAMLGITTETASRTIAEFRRQRLIVEFEPNHFRCNLPGLEKIAAT